MNDTSAVEPQQCALTPEQKQHALVLMREYLDAPKNSDGRTPPERQAERDAERRQLIRDELKPLLDGYLEGQIALAEFKSTIDGINKRHEHWGFKGIKGQMFFNMLLNVAGDTSECDEELRSALALPTNENMAKSRLNTFINYVTRISEQYVEAGGSKRSCPKFRSVPFFVSYFWQIHAHNIWPVFYTNSVNVMTDLNLWRPSEDLAENYIHFKHRHEQLAELFTEGSGTTFGLYDVEHVFWFKRGDPYTKPGGPQPPSGGGNGRVPSDPEVIDITHLPESYVPPVVAILPQMARRHQAVEKAAKASGTTIDHAFEHCMNAAFTILGYEAQRLGQGHGRVPDGIATEIDNNYAILWDAKGRAEGYNMGTDDRTIREYITTQSRELKRRRPLRNIYYVIISSSFKDGWDDAVRGLKMDTDVSEVCLVEADAIVAMVDAKLRDPQQVTLGSDGLQRLFSTSGTLTAEDVQNLFS